MFEEDRDSLEWKGLDDKQIVIQAHVKDNKKKAKAAEKQAEVEAEKVRIDRLVGEGEGGETEQKKHVPLFGRNKGRDYYSRKRLTQPDSFRKTWQI